MNWKNLSGTNTEDKYCFFWTKCVKLQIIWQIIPTLEVVKRETRAFIDFWLHWMYFDPVWCPESSGYSFDSEHWSSKTADQHSRGWKPFCPWSDNDGTLENIWCGMMVGKYYLILCHNVNNFPETSASSTIIPLPNIIEVTIILALLFLTNDKIGLWKLIIKKY